MKQLFPSGLRILTWAALSAALITTSCKKDDTDDGGNGGEPTPAPVTLTDQLEYDGGDPIDIKSVVYEIDEENAELYTFYLSPTEGLQTVKQMEGADDYLKLVVTKPHGEVDTATEDFEISYQDISISKLTLNTDVEKVQLSTNLLEMSNQFVLYLDVTMKSGKTLLARYNNECVQYKLPTLNNQYALDDAVTKIGSIVEWADLTAGTTTYYVYDAEGVTGTPTTETPAAMTIQLASSLDAEQIVNGRLTAGSTLKIDLSTADLSKVSIQSGEFQTAQGVTGTLTLKKDRNDDMRFTLELDIENADSRLRADYNNSAIAAGYKSSNHMTVTVNDEAKVDADLATIYRYDNQSTGGYQFALGVPDPDAEEPKEGLASLTTGSYAVQMNIGRSDVGKTFDLATDADKINFYVYDYAAYTTYDPKMATGEGATGTIRVIGVGTDTYYVNVDVQFPKGPSVKAEWYGTFTSTDEDMTTPLTPVAPFRPSIVVNRPDGSNILDWEINQVMVRHDPKYAVGGGPYIAAYVFYFVNEKTKDDIENNVVTPFLAISEEYLTCDVADMKAESNLKWQFKFTYQAGEKVLYASEYGSLADYMARTPDESSLLISKEGTQWKITFKMKDWGGLQYSYPNPLQNGTNNTLTIDWEGPLSPYTGSKTNDLDASFFEK